MMRNEGWTLGDLDSVLSEYGLRAEELPTGTIARHLNEPRVEVAARKMAQEEGAV